MKPLEFTPTVPHLFPAAHATLTEPLFSHRSDRFTELFRRTSGHLKHMCGNRLHPVIAAGTGSWANELMVWNILPHVERAAVVINGEFGTRLYRQCSACRIDTIPIELPWGDIYDLEIIEAVLKENPDIDCIFGVATETSCGMSNDLQALNDFLAPRGIRLCLDGVSAVGVAPEVFHLSQLAMLSASSGKALAALPGISIVFCDRSLLRPLPAGIPDLLDISKIIAAETSPGMVRNTLGSVLLSCLAASLDELSKLDDYPGMLRNHKNRIVESFKKIGIEKLPNSSSPMVTTFKRPPETQWESMLKALDDAGIRLYTSPEYLKARHLFQVATMGNVGDHDIDRLLQTVETCAAGWL